MKLTLNVPDGTEQRLVLLALRAHKTVDAVVAEALMSGLSDLETQLDADDAAHAAAPRPTPQEIIRADLGAMLVEGKTYPATLPLELAAWYCYTLDGGHSLYVVLAVLEEFPGENIFDSAAPAPVKSVLRAGYEIRNGVIWSNLAYDKELGVVVEDGEEEF